jgi:methionyl aminopeptidase
LDFIRPKVVAGVTTAQLDRLVHEYTLDHGHIPACLGYQGFPKSICTSINEVVCHGIPDNTQLRDGDIINVDLTTIVAGWYGDQSETFLIGKVSDTARRLVQVTFDCLCLGIRAIKPHGRVIDIGAAIAEHAHAQGFQVVRQFHQDPGIPHFPHPSNGSETIPPGVCFTIEPMLNVGTWETVLDHNDKWTVRTKDGSLSAQFEHTILMTDSGPEILTLTKAGPQEGHVF